MMTDTDFHMIKDLMDKFKPATRGIISQAESDLVSDILKIRDRTDVELQNVRDMVVILYGNAANTGEPRDAIGVMDAMSAVTAVIDKEKGRRGLEV